MIDTTPVLFCPYCGSQRVIASGERKMSASRVPDKVYCCNECDFPFRIGRVMVPGRCQRGHIQVPRNVQFCKVTTRAGVKKLHKRCRVCLNQRQREFRVREKARMAREGAKHVLQRVAVVPEDDSTVKRKAAPWVDRRAAYLAESGQ